LALFTAVALGAAGCSSDSGRFNDGLFNSASAPPPQQQMTGSVVPQPTSRIDSQPLPQPQMGALPPQTRPASVAAAPVPGPGMAGGGKGMASYQPASYQPAGADVTGSVVPPPQAPQLAHGRWTWEGGTTMSAAPGDTVGLLATRYGVPSAALAQVNGLAPNATLQPGQRIVIPRYQSSAQGPSAPRPTATAQATSGEHIIAPGETLMKLSRLYGKSLSEIAAANNIAPNTMVKVGDRIVIPGVRTAARPAPAAVAATPAPQRVAATAPPGQAAPRAPAPAAAAWPNPKVASADSTTAIRMVAPATEKVKDDPEPEAAPGGPGFRWPVRGRVIAGFGPKPAGQQNDGINLAVPEGTPVKASDDGVVAYAGNELKGYGNLVLVRHSNGYVTAYAHASELMVKRGDTVKRGQVIAKSGQTGNVTSPQLHFEVRKGASPVDPMQFLTGAT
jgi:murein DD-endopeptidase MepM/ murein hydrolase activator NlpD